MTRAGAEGAVTVSALVVGSVWAYRKLIEPVASAESKASESSSAVLKIIGAEPTPATAAQFAVGFGFTFFSLGVIATFAPDVAGGMAILVAVGDLLVNGASVFTDVSNQVTSTTAPGSGASRKRSGATAGEK